MRRDSDQDQAARAEGRSCLAPLAARETAVPFSSFVRGAGALLNVDLRLQRPVEHIVGSTCMNTSGVHVYNPKRLHYSSQNPPAPRRALLLRSPRGPPSQLRICFDTSQRRFRGTRRKRIDVYISGSRSSGGVAFVLWVPSRRGKRSRCMAHPASGAPGPAPGTSSSLPGRPLLSSGARVGE